jgi:large subunit ribosomal protein L17
MRHRNTGRRLSMDTSERTAMFRNMITSLLLHGTIRTTEARAKELRRFAERVITTAKRAPKTDGLDGDALQKAKVRRVHHIRMARRWVIDPIAMHLLFEEYVDRFATRPGGYTRIIKAGRRNGDNAPMAILALVGTLSAEAAPSAVAEEPVAAAPSEPAATETAPEAPKSE